jgi:hypothetical protein
MMMSAMEVIPKRSKDEIPMTTEILNVVIDERKQLQDIDDITLLDADRRFVMGQASQRRVFKDYILSSEVFYIDSTLS